MTSIKELCRICLNSDTSLLKDLFTTNMYEKVIYSTGIEISENDQLPNKICIECSQQIEIAYEIKRKCLETDILLRKNDYIQEEEEVVTVDHQNDESSDEKEKDKNKSKKRSKNKRPQDQDYKCFICDKMFNLITEKNLHIRRDHTNDSKICTICNARKQTATSLESHLKFHVFGSQYRYLCSVCGKNFKFKNLLENHLKVEHYNSIQFTCDLCNYSTKFKINLHRHIKSFHLKLKNFVCSFDNCNSQYSTQVGLNLHMYRMHSIEAPITCKACLQGFTFDSELRVHKKHCTGSTKKKARSQDSPVDVLENGSFRCQVCEQIFETRAKWSVHFHHKHKHSNICQFCEKQLASSTSLAKHIHVQHNKIKQFQCNVCNKSFGFKHSLQSHLNLHNGTKPFQCDHDKCQFRAADRSSISKHKKKVHRLCENINVVSEINGH